MTTLQELIKYYITGKFQGWGKTTICFILWFYGQGSVCVWCAFIYFNFIYLFVWVNICMVDLTN